eukprot:324793-Rhodomonas_salina.1
MGAILGAHRQRCQRRKQRSCHIPSKGAAPWRRCTRRQCACWGCWASVSYTHLTLPTICSV